MPLFPPEIVSEAGTETPGFVDASATVVGSPGPLRVTVQVPPLPGTTLVGLHASDERFGLASKDRVVVTDDAPMEALIMADPAEATVPAAAVNEEVAAVAGTVTDAGTVTEALLEFRDTVVPPVGAGLESVTVQGVVTLEARLEAVHCSEDTVIGAVRVNVALCELIPRLAVTDAL